MKTKPILIIAAIVIVAVSAFFLFHKKKTVANSDEITEFLFKFDNGVIAGNADSLMTFFQFDKKSKGLKNLANILAGGKKGDGSKPLTIIKLDIGKAIISIDKNGLVTAKIPITFSYTNLNDKQSVLILKIHKVAANNLKIVQADARQFLTDYTDYETYARNSMHIDNTTYSAITLASFKTADQLKTRYDSVLWFEHIDGKTFYYVIKGKLNKRFYWNLEQKEKETPTYKMGLVNPDLKEIIPTEYDLIHNVGGTIDGLVEVEMNEKKGLYNLNGKNVVVVIYDQIIPLNDDSNLALLRKDDNYFYLKKDTTVTDKIDGFKIADALPKFKNYDNSYSMSGASSKNIMEYNERGNITSLITPPSYLVDLQILNQFINLNNPLRKGGIDGEEVDPGSKNVAIKYNGTESDDKNWFTSVFYSIVDDFWDGRGGLYQKSETKKVLFVDKKQNKILGFEADGFMEDDGEEGEGSFPISTKCSENHIRAIDDTLFEYKTSSAFSDPLSEKDTINEGTYYSYLHIKNGKLETLPNTRIFGCTKYVKMDDSYLDGCFIITNKRQDHVNAELLEYMKNEIYASYGYKFKTDKWTNAFRYRFDRYDGAKNVTVNDSLTDIEKYNINWINSKLSSLKQTTLAAQ
ncbi:YARHG domain-containing protein [Mucilaginibacter sp. X4EP1]|uniref:YARHG domain-containing protein n=1 Tax=Mucilaginibacter sp. X4EP1 TaxID=2723092 RepID=UPI00216A0CA3|nr:YARHG domain-containing protein [Mucilaginibacter sp. X4EP1]MCS3814306.1 hypothetical protein [Mucilaginibacter sp. X4EP1]